MATPGIHEDAAEIAENDVAAHAVEAIPLPQSVRAAAAGSGVTGRPVGSEIREHGNNGRNDRFGDPSSRPAPGGLALHRSAEDKLEAAKSSVQIPLENLSDTRALPQAEAAAETKSKTAAIGEAMDEVTGRQTAHGIDHEDSHLVVHALKLSTSDEDSSNDHSSDDRSSIEPHASMEARADESEEGYYGEGGNDGSGNGPLVHRAPGQRLADLRVTLRFHRSSLYLIGAVLVAAVALFWPAAGSPRKGALSPFERALVTLGLADAPDPVVHVQGDPGIEVWIDPHTALYYCPGEEQYGKIADGRLSSQHDAQLDRFEPAGHLACE